MTVYSWFVDLLKSEIITPDNMLLKAVNAVRIAVFFLPD